jgi:hypothetical protein
VSALNERVRGLEERLRARAQEVVDKAMAAHVGEDPSWDAFLLGLKLKPLVAALRLEILQQGVPNLRGALPVEVRRAFEAIRREGERDLRPLMEELKAVDAQGGDVGDVEARIDKLRHELEALVDREMREYLAKCRPKITVSSIFANAQMTSVRMGDDKDGVKTKKCGCCGAARPEGTDLKTCAFCGNDFFAAPRV